MRDLRANRDEARDFAGLDGFGKAGTHWLNVVGRLQAGVSAERGLAAARPVWTATLRHDVAEIGV